VAAVPAHPITIFSFARGRQALRKEQRVQLHDQIHRTSKLLGPRDDFSKHYTAERAETESDHELLRYQQIVITRE